MEKIQVHLIIEVLGRPAENVTRALQGLLEKISSEKGVRILEKKINTPVLAKDSQDLFTSFMELSLELDSIENYFGILFAYMPSNIEIISPERISLSNVDLTHIANQLTSRLHNYDAIVKNVVFERDIYAKKLKEVAPHLFKKAPEKSEKNKEKIKKEKPKKAKGKKKK